MDFADQAKIAAKLCELWPEKYKDSELTDFAERMSQYPIGEVLAAIDIHRNEERFHPHPSSILDVIKQERARRKPAGTTKTLSFADAVRKQDEQLRGVTDDREVVLRSWRKQWFACQRTDSMKKKCRVSCTNTLVTECGMDTPLAERYAETIFLDVEGFRHVLEELRGFVETPFDAQTNRDR